MKIYINGRCLNSFLTGIANYTLELAEQFALAGHEVVLITNNRNISVKNVKIVYSSLQKLGPIYDFLLFQLESKGADVLFSPANSGPIFSLNGIKLSTIHDMSLFDRPSDLGLLNKVAIQISIKIAYYFSNILITDSLFSKKRISEILGKKKSIYVVYLGVNTKKLAILVGNKRSIKNKFVIVTNSTHHKRKNVLGLVEAIKLSKYSKDIKLFTTGVVISNLKDNFVVQKGYLKEKDLYFLIKSADIFIYPSFYEGFGLPVLEASVLGVNILTSNASSLPEIVHNKLITFNPNNIREMANKIDWLLGLSSNQRKDLIDKQKKFASQFTWKKTARNILKLINNYETKSQ